MSNSDDVKPPHIMIVEARFYDDIADAAMEGVTSALEEVGATFECFQVAGAFEIPAAISHALIQQDLYDTHRFDGYIALGCVIRGETTHYDIISEESARGLMDLSLEYGLALGNGILTVENREQAMDRAMKSRKDKGGEAARACLGMIEHKRAFNLFPREEIDGGAGRS